MASFIKSDLEFILQQIFFAERHAAGESLASMLPNPEVPFGLRTIDGTFNNVVPGRSEFGAADNVFPRLTDPVFRTAEDNPFIPGTQLTSYTQTSGLVFDSQPRTISNLIVDMTANNPAAVAAAAQTPGSEVVTGTRTDGTTFQTFFIPNVAPDVGLSAPFNQWMTFFGQFFDHGLDLVNKGGNGTVFIPLKPDDPLFVPDSPTNFMVLTRATMLPGPDGVLGTADDIHENVNQDSPFVDQNQTYSAHPSHQVFLRAYELNAAGQPVATGKLLVNRDLGADGHFGTADDVVLGGMSTWRVLKAQARDLLGINLTDRDFDNVPLLATDPYGNFLRGPNGFVQVVMQNPDGTTSLVEGNPAAPISLVNAVRTGHAFLNDIAFAASPVDSQTGAPLLQDADTVAGGPVAPGFYDNELLDAHYMAGDGRVNENIGLTAVHHIFHSEHNRLVDQTKETVLASADLAFLNQWLLTPVAALPTTPAQVGALQWNGERLFQAAKFGTEMQYQHLVFEEFARTIQPQVNAFIDFNDTINPAIVAEFAHTVYRFGHSMLLETVDRLDPNFASSEIGLIQAFLNPLAFNQNGSLTPEQAAGAIIRGTTRQVGNEIDEFVTEALRNNLLGLPLDLPTINLARGRDTGIPSLNAARRTFFAGTGDSQLTPYTSWFDFAQHIKHPESLVNFIAAYGTHLTITAATTLAGKRDAASLIVLGGVGAPADRLDFLYSTGDWASGADGVTITGLDAVDLWVGGLAEEKMPFGGMLGSTFNFVFETQLESLQNGDRLYYLHRLQGQNFLKELENNTFSNLIKLNTNVTHLPALSFSTPGLTLEVAPLQQFNANVANNPGPDGVLFDNPATPVDESADNIATPREDPLGDNPSIPLVIRDNPATVGPDTNYLQYTGHEHVVLGGTAANNILMSSDGDDTLYGDAGNDRLEGGYGNDQLFGGPGDDIITDAGGDDVIHGEEGNDVINAGPNTGVGNIVLGGPGKDFIITGEDFTETFAGTGDDFILGSRLDAFPSGNEGDDWLERGLQDGAAGDNFDPFGRDPIAGNDVFLGDGGFDETLGEGGDDIVVGSEGGDKYDGASGYDWVTFKDEHFGVTSDFFHGVIAPVGLPAPPVAASVAGLARFFQLEGASGSAHADILRGDDVDAAQILVAGAKGSVLTNLDLISGLRAFLGTAAAGPDGITGTADDQFGSGNILLGGDGSDILEGRGGDDLLDGDRWLNVRISVRQNLDGTGPQIRSVNYMQELIPDMLSGAINPGQLVIVREILPGAGGFDTAVFSGNRADYTVVVNNNGTPLNFSDDIVTVTDNVAARDGSDRLTHLERLQFNDQAVVLVPGLNAEPTGRLAVSDTTPAVGQTLTVSPGTVADANSITGRLTYIWQQETAPGSGVFRDYAGPAGRLPIAFGDSFTVTEDLAGLALRVKAHYVDGHGVQETVFSTSTAAVGPGTPPPAPAPLLNGLQTGIVSPGVHFLGSDLQFILAQIKLAERQAAGEDPVTLVDNLRLPQGLRTVDGSFNNLVQAQSEFGASDNVFPRLTTPVFRPAERVTIDLDGPGPLTVGTPTSYQQTSGFVFDSQPRTISNLIVDMTANNPAAVAAAAQTPGAGLVTGTRTDGTSFETFFIPNQAPDVGLSAPFNAWMTFFGQFFDHGLDLVNKGGNGTVFMPLQPDDPLFNSAPGAPNFMVLTRATMLPGPDGVLGTADDIHENVNQDSPFVDQNQTYSAHPSHQVFLRAYEFNAAGDPVATGKMIVNRDLGADGQFGTADDMVIGGMATWAVVKAQARDLLGINLTDADVFDVPLLATDPYGKFMPGANGFAQMVVRNADGTTSLLEGNPAANGGNGVNVPANVVRTGHQFLNDIAHSADPSAAPGLVRDNNGVIGGPQPAGTYDGELLDAHYMAGDGRVNENIGLTTVHHIFHSEHNRLVDHTKAVVLDTARGGDVSFLNEWLITPVTAVPANLSTLVWNGERLFQAAKFGTEMQYQHLVFEEFARTIQPNIDVIIPGLQNYQAEINPAIVAEFAHTVYRFGHSMLTETIDRLDPNFVSSEIGLIQAFLNPLAFEASGPTPEAAAGAIVRGVTRQIGNEIDEFVTEALRNNLLGLPLDLPSINLARARDTGIPSLNAARREFYRGTGDSNLTPYTSWADFVQHLRHPESLINFIAAYGRHPTITATTTLAAKRAAASLIVLGGGGAPADRLDFLYSTGDWANTSLVHPKDVDGVTTTGLGDIDFWIGGLAEQQTPFGGMLGSTFNFVFENQLEKLQNADRFYYLERTSGLNFQTELENNSFAKLIMANTDATHLPSLVFKVNLILEADQTRQFNEVVIPGPDGILGNDDDLPGSADPVGDNPIVPLVMRDDPTTPGLDPNYLKYTGEDHVVLGGTEGNDTLIAGIGDDTLYGDGGNDRLEGGDGNDTIRGGAGDDIITDTGGDDVIQGDDGNDVIHGGNGFNLIIAGFGKDFVNAGTDTSEVFGGPGNDFVMAGDGNEQTLGNEGDDWLEGGLLDGSPGDNFDPFGQDLVIGNDVYIGTGGPDIMMAEGGDDIMVGSSSAVNFNGDKYLGASGFDWATFKDEAAGVGIDMIVRAFNAAPGPVAAGVVAKFASVEGLSGSDFSDLLRGDDATALTIPISGAQGSVLTNFDLISGLRAFVGAAAAGPDGLVGTTDDQFGAGNILLGGDGSDLIEGRAGDDLIDGDRWLNVRISVRQNADGTGPEIDSFDSMVPMLPLMLDGTYNPGQLVAVREILPGSGGFNFDTVWFSGPDINYDIDTTAPDGTIIVTDLVGTDGTDRLTGIERLQFADLAVVLETGLNNEPVDSLTVSDPTPRVGQTLTVSGADIFDADNTAANGAVPGPFSFFWQFEARAGSGIFEDIVILTGLGAENATGPSFTVTPALAGLVLRVRAVYQDEHGVLETVFSAPTDGVGALIIGTAASDTLTGTPFADDISGLGGNDTINALAGDDLISGGLDNDILNGDAGNDTFTYTIGDGADAVDGGTELDTLTIIGTAGVDTLDVFFNGTALTQFEGGTVANVETVTANLMGGSDTLNYGTTPAAVTVNLATGNASGFSSIANIEHVTGGAGADTLTGNALANTLTGGAGNDTLNGGAGADILIGGTGNDTYGVDNAADVVTEDAGAGTDTVQTTLGNYTLGANVENLTFTGSGNFVGTGTALANILTGGAGNDTLTGGAGNDTLNGGAGADILIGGTGNDTYGVDNAADVVTEDAGAGTDTVQTTLGSYTLGANVENLTFTGSGNFAGTGTALANIITGGAGNDTLNGGAGADTLIGGAGNDTYGVDNAADVVTETAGAGTDTVQTTLGSYTLGANVENLTFTGSGNFAGTGTALANVITGGAGNDTLNGGAGADTLIGGTGNDTLNGGAGADTLIGGAGNDTLNGGAGADTLIGGAGNDTYGVDNAADVVTETAGAGTDTVQTTLGSYTLGANVENLTFTGSGNFAGTGNALANTLTGGAGADTLTGGDGNDTLQGGGGADTLNGGLGNDTLNGGAARDVMNGNAGDDVFGFGPGSLVNVTDSNVNLINFAAQAVVDVINDFDADPTGGQDHIDLSGFGIISANFSTQVSIVDVSTVPLLNPVADTLVRINGQGEIWLNNIASSTITQTDFILA